MAPPRWDDKRLEADRTKAIEAFREERLTEPLEAYLDVFESYRDAFDDLLETTIDLDAIVANAVELLRRNTDGARSILARVLVGKIRVRWNGRGAPLSLIGSGGAAGLLSLDLTATGAERVSSASPAGPERSPLCESFVIAA